MILKHFLLIAIGRWLIAAFAGICQCWSLVRSSIGVILNHQVVEGIEASGDFTCGLDSSLFVPIVIGMLVVHEAGLKASSIGCMLRSGHPSIPFPSVVRPVAPLPHLFAHARHVARDAGVAADGILGVRGRHRHVLHQDVGRQAAAEQGGTGRATDAVGIVAIQLNTLLHQLIDGWSLNLQLSLLLILCLGGAVEANVGPTQIVSEEEKDVRL
mmetsp:Transcript_48616/g.77393  ORF Transcript_48616/g.77393 Transcript_48616/m.77393 type:complete len:213 (+) Transcript_48616:1439-2077(+)